MLLPSQETNQPLSAYTAFDFTTSSLFKVAVPPTRPRVGTPFPITTTTMPPKLSTASSHQCPLVSGLLADLAAKDATIAAKDEALCAYRTQFPHYKHALDVQKREKNARKRTRALRAAYDTPPLPIEILEPDNNSPPSTSSDASTYVPPQGIDSPHHGNIGILSASTRLHRSNRDTDPQRQLMEKLVFVSAYQEAYHQLPDFIEGLKAEVHEGEEELDIVRTRVEREGTELERVRGERGELLRSREGKKMGEGEKRHFLRLLAKGKEGRECEGEARGG